jgi:hypothetical protein
VERRSGGEDVIYQKDFFPDHWHTLAQSEGVAQVPHSILSVKSGLCLRVAPALQAGKQGDGGPLGNNFPDRLSLVESSAPATGLGEGESARLPRRALSRMRGSLKASHSQSARMRRR